MLSLANTESVVTTILLLCSYAISATLSEAGQAWVANKLGDDSAADEGWLSLNPLHHVDLIGTILVLIIGFSWVRMVPMNPMSRLTNGQRLLVYMTQGLISFFTALVTLVMLVWQFGQQSLPLAFSMFMSEHAPLKSITELYPDKSSGVLIFGLFLVSMVIYNLFIASLSFIINGIRHVLARGDNELRFDNMKVWLIAFLFLLLFANPLRTLLLGLVTKGALIISRLIGAV